MSVPRAWKAATLTKEDWLLPVPKDVEEELVAAARSLERQERPILAARAEDFELGATRLLMQEANQRIEEACGFVVIDRVPVDTLSSTAKSGLAWLLGSMIGRVVAQKWHGTFLYDVRDTGKALQHGVRRSITNLEQGFHTDGPWLHWPPETIGLFCLQPASQGGESRIVSLLNACNEMAAAPDLLRRLQQPVCWDRQAEHDPDDAGYSREPMMFEDDRGRAIRWYPDYVRKGAQMAEEPLDRELIEAMARFQSILEQPPNHIEFKLEAGQLLYLDNRRVSHSRKAFQDGAANRHYIRIWNRNQGTHHLEGKLPLNLDP